ncbi:MAG: hypothetical protein GC181_10320 [Bacteroidetes bacterium]|nr:hypothetical protein [Bacteroidota bacterium]
MKLHFSKIALIALPILALVFFSFDLPSGWFKAGANPEMFDMGVDRGAGRNNGNAGTIKSIKKSKDAWGTLMSTCLPGKYSAKRVRMSGYIKAADVKGWAGLWLRVDSEGGKTLSFDNMHDGKTDRSISGTSEWTKYEVVLDVPKEAAKLAYGVLLSGTGQIWFDDIKFEIVEKTVSTTGKEQTDNTPKEPVNLDFEK